MKVETRFYDDKEYWDAAGKMLNDNKAYGYELFCENHGSFIAIRPTIKSPFFVYIQIGSWTLEYKIFSSASR